MVTIAIYRFVTKRLHKSIRHWFATNNYRMTRELLKAVLKIRSLQVALRLESVFLFTVFLCCSKLFLFYISARRRRFLREREKVEFILVAMLGRESCARVDSR